MKNEVDFPEYFKNVYISSIPKKTKILNEIESERGIFLTNKVRSIFMKLLKNTNIDNIENNLKGERVYVLRSTFLH